VTGARPTCAVCLRLVDRLEEEIDGFGRLVLRAVCHGQVERVVFDPGEGAPASVTGLGPARLES